jgi:predicted outer membrane repeat protein
MKAAKLGIGALLLLSCPVAPFAGTCVVAPNGSGDFSTIQAAINAARAGDVIELTDGVFAGTGNRDLDFLGKAITVRSMNGDPATCVIDCGGSEAERHRGFVFRSAEGPTAHLTGVGIRDGYAQTDGGGIQCREHSSPTITNCRIVDCVAGYWGGGLAIVDSSPVVSDCTFEGNSAPEYGGGAYCSGLVSVTFDGCVFRDNTARVSGGGLTCGVGTISAHDCVFENNHADFGGGGIASMLGSLLLEDCTLRGNSAQTGGGVGDNSETFTCKRCLFVNNVASAGAGALGCNGGTVRMEDCTMGGNQSSNGSSIDLAACVATVTGCTIAENATAPNGAAIHCSGSQSSAFASTLIVGTTGGRALLCNGGDPTLDCCDIFGNAGGDWIDCIESQLGQDGNISLTPQFCSPAPNEDENWSLQSDSPCAPEQSGCGLIGAWDVGCRTTPVENRTWGGVKLLFRE